MKKLSGLLLLAAVLFASCERQEQPTIQGKAVKFTTSAVSVNTKTSYKGEAQNGIEDILWDDGDTFTVWSDQASVAGTSQKWANYSVSAEGGVVSAVNPAEEGVELLWGERDHNFFASYPADKLVGNVIKATIPDYQILKQTDNYVFLPVLSEYGIMYAAAKASPGKGCVNLEFYPLFNTFEFTVSACDDVDALVSGFRLEVQNGSKRTIAGNFLATLSTEAKPDINIDYSNAKGIISLQFGDNRSIRIPRGSTLTFSVITYPVAMGNLTAVFTVNGKELAVPLVDEEGAPIMFEPGQKANICFDGVFNRL